MERYSSSFFKKDHLQLYVFACTGTSTSSVDHFAIFVNIVHVRAHNYIE